MFCFEKRDDNWSWKLIKGTRENITRTYTNWKEKKKKKTRKVGETKRLKDKNEL